MSAKTRRLPRPDPKLARLVEVNRAIALSLITRYRPDCCIAATRVTQRVLAEWDVHVTPMPVKLVVMNQPMIDRINREQRYPRDRDESVRWGDECGAWSVGVGHGVEARDVNLATPGAKWDGHLVGVIRDWNGDDWIVDNALGQASRPERQMALPWSFVTRVDRTLVKAWRTGNTPHFTYGIPGAVLIYEAVPDNLGYLTSPDWHDPTHTDAATAEALRRAVTEDGSDPNQPEEGDATV